METRRQSEKVLQKAKEKERAQATRISDEEKRNSAITNAMKNWQVIKKQHRKLVRKPSESSTSEGIHHYHNSDGIVIDIDVYCI